MPDNTDQELPIASALKDVDGIPVSRIDNVVQKWDKAIDKLTKERHQSQFTTHTDKDSAIGGLEEVHSITQTEVAEIQSEKPVRHFDPRRLRGRKTQQEIADRVGQKQDEVSKLRNLLQELKPQRTGQNIDQDIQRAIGIRSANVEQRMRGGPLTASPEMQQALRKQDVIAYYSKIGIDVHEYPEFMLPLNIFERFYKSMNRPLAKHAYIESTSMFKNYKEKDAMKFALASTFNAAAIKYAHERNIELNEDLLYQLMLPGTRGAELPIEVPYSFSKEFSESRINNGGITKPFGDPYAKGAAMLDYFFRENGIPEGEERVPYILMFAGGRIFWGGDWQRENSAKYARDWILLLGNIKPDMDRAEGMTRAQGVILGVRDMYPQAATDDHLKELWDAIWDNKGRRTSDSFYLSEWIEPPFVDPSKDSSEQNLDKAA